MASIDYPDEYEFIGSKNSYFSAKVRACLQYKRLPYVETTANIEAMRRVRTLTGDLIYPVVVCPDGAVLRDGCDIVAELERRHPERPVIPEDPVLHLAALLLELVADEFMLQSSIGFRWHDDASYAWSRRMFSQISSERVRDPETRQRGVDNGARVADSIRQAMGRRSDSQWAWSREVTRELCDRFEAHLQGTPFFLGDRPCLADLGMMNALFGHLYRDPGEICDYLHEQCISVSLWIDHMLAAAGESDRGELTIAPTLEAVLAAFGKAYGERATELALNANRELSGMETGTEIRTGANNPHYSAWRIQRLRDHLASVPADRRDEAEGLLEVAGFRAACEVPADWRMEKREQRLHLV